MEKFRDSFVMDNSQKVVLTVSEERMSQRPLYC